MHDLLKEEGNEGIRAGKKGKQRGGKITLCVNQSANEQDKQSGKMA